MKIAINWIFFISVIVINALANILPINGYNTGQISAFYPNYFVPAGFTFSIWGVIYLLLLAYTIAYTYYVTQSAKFIVVNKYLNKINPFFLLTCVLNIVWIFAWHYLQVELSFIIMLFFLTALCKIFVIANKSIDGLTQTQRFLLYTPFTIYLGWISVATIANLTALLVKLSWAGLGIEAIYWSSLMILTAIALALFFLFKYGTIGYAIVIVWALWGIKASQGNMQVINICSSTGILLLIGTIVYIILSKSRKRIAQ